MTPGTDDRRVARLADERGQAILLLLGTLAAALALASVGVALLGAVTAKGRVQRAADLAALSAARSMRDDHSRLFAPAFGPGGRPNPDHLSREQYLRRGADAARRAARENGIGAGSTVTVSHPDRESIAPVRVAVEIAGRAGAGGERDPEPVIVAATAEVVVGGGTPLPGAGQDPVTAEGGGYAGPLELRQGKGMRPDVARAFDRMAATAATAGHGLVINSAFRSDAEQARLFAANPDPRWVARPGTSLHRCATELDLGPPSAHPWLAANAGAFGFTLRYPWEPWHFGFDGGPPPCSAEAEEASTADGRGEARLAESGRRRPGSDGRTAARPGLPGYVPPAFRRPLLAAAARHGVDAELLAAQLMAESNFNPAAVSPAGARGIAQFMPATAAAYGLADPFDPEASIDAQARLMRDLLARFGRSDLALAAYNVGPAPVERCDCVPAYPETQAYVSKILGLLAGGSAAAPGPAPALEVRLVD